jgi:hypothetical protein
VPQVRGPARGGLAEICERTRTAIYAESLRPRFAARSRMARRSPGRKRMVIRSRAVSSAVTVSPFARPGLADSSRARIATRASLLSEIPRAVAIEAKRCFSSAVGRAVIDGRGRLAVPSVMTKRRGFVCECDALPLFGVGMDRGGRIARCPQSAAPAPRDALAPNIVVQHRCNPSSVGTCTRAADVMTAHVETDSDIA